MPQKIINSKEKTNIHCIQRIFQNILQPIIYKKTGLNGYLYNFSVDYNIIDVSDFIKIHKYFMKKYNDVLIN